MEKPEIDPLLEAAVYPDGLLPNDVLDVDDVVLEVHPVGKFVEMREFDFALDKTGGRIVGEGWNDWDEPAGPEKRVTSKFAKGTIGHRLGITRVEETIIDGEKWSYGYAGDELVSARVLNSFV